MINWNTKKGSLGTVTELEFLSVQLKATDSNSLPLEYRVQSGETPPGTYVTSDGIFKGVPAISGTTTSEKSVYTFTVRAANEIGDVADRTFSLTVNLFYPIRIVDKPSDNVWRIGSFDDGDLLSKQFYAISSRANSNITWRIVDGQVPTDIRTGEPIVLSSNGLLSGYISRLIDLNSEIPGYGREAVDAFPYDFTVLSRSVRYIFTIQVSDGLSTDSVKVEVNIVSKGYFTADNDINTVDTDFLTIDADNRYIPIITTDPSVIPIMQAGNKFAFKFDAIDPEDDTISWTANNVPNGLTLSSTTGWLTGTMPSQIPDEITYEFTVRAFKRDEPERISNPLTVSITSLKDSNNYVGWITPPTIGTMINGQLSELKVQAFSNLNKDLTYSVTDGQLPFGLALNNDGVIIGRTSFKHFVIDGYRAEVDILDVTDNITVGMTVQGPGVGSGSVVTEIIDAHTLVISPSINVPEGTELTFSDLVNDINITTRTTSLSTTTSIDDGNTTFDCNFTFTVEAVTDDFTASSTRDFTIVINNYNRAPYENVYLKALPSIEQRQLFFSILSNQSIFPPSLLYRPTDPAFGLAKDIRMLFLAGLSASELSAYANAIALNHYNKTINLGAVKTARAVDSNLKVKYEVVYLEIIDDKVSSTGVSAGLSLEPKIYTNYDNNPNYRTIYPNSFNNMAYRLASGVGYSYQGAVPDWMSSPQENGRVLGLTRGIVLAYTVPGASKLIAYRLANNNIRFDAIQFIADRYSVDTSGVINYSFATNTFGDSNYIYDEIIHDIEVNPENPTELLAGTWAQLVNPGKDANDPDLVVIEAVPGPQVNSGIDNYADPFSNDKYIKFPQIGVYK